MGAFCVVNMGQKRTDMCSGIVNISIFGQQDFFLPDRAHQAFSIAVFGWLANNCHKATRLALYSVLGDASVARRGVHKRYLAQYVVIFEWEYNLKSGIGTLLRAIALDAP